jgi:hypothetical protein
VPAAVAVVALARRMSRSWPAFATSAITAITLLVAAPSIQSTIAFDRLAAQADTRLVAAAWVDAHRQSADWIQEEFPASLHPEWGRAPDVKVARFDADRGVFVSDKDKNTLVTPDWIAIGTSALKVYSDHDAQLQPLMAGKYELVATFPATSGPEPSEIFDRQDHFFFPYSDFSQRLRSGPEIRIYRRVASR